MIVLIVCYKDANLDNHPDNISKHGFESESTYKARAVRRYCSICSVKKKHPFLIKCILVRTKDCASRTIFCPVLENTPNCKQTAQDTMKTILRLHVLAKKLQFLTKKRQ